MEIKTKSTLLICRAEGEPMLRVWESMALVGMKMYASFNGFINVGNALRGFNEKSRRFVKVDLEAYLDFSILIITNSNLINMYKDLDSVTNSQTESKDKK